jgi:hypothetical protein
MLAAHIIARPLSLPSRSTFEGSPLPPSLAQKQTLRARPIVVQGGFIEGVKNFFLAPKPKMLSAPRVDPFFNRTEEQKEFRNNVLNDESCAINVLLGPPNCGKSVRSA